MKKSEILNDVFGSRVISYYIIEGTNTLAVIVQELIWTDFTKRFLNQLIDVQAYDDNTIRVTFLINDWN